MTIVDIDFRYVARVVPSYENASMAIGKLTPFLQFRKKIVTHDFGDLKEFHWTEWEDVRTEEE